MKRIQLMFAYHEFLKGGKYFTAHKILELLNKKKVYLGLDDTSWEVEQLAYKLKLPNASVKPLNLFMGI